MRVAVVGAGGIGGFFGALLSRAGHDLTLIARGSHLEFLRAHGLSLRSPTFGEFTVQTLATDRCEEVGPVDLVLMCVKTYDLDAASVLAGPLIGQDTVVLPLQNGVDAVERIGKAVGQQHLLGGATYVAAARDGAAILHAGGDRLVFGELEGGLSDRTALLQGALTQAGIAAEVHPNIRLAIWEKFAVVCGTGGVMALTRLPIGPVLAVAETAALMHDAVAEAADVGRAGGLPLADDYADRVMDLLAGYPPSTKSSMLTDLEAGRRLELEAINEAAVRLGRERQVPTPANAAIYAALKPYADGRSG